MNTRVLSLFSLLFACSVISCNQGGVGPSDLGGQNFSLTITVVNGSGNPVEGLVVSAWNHMAVGQSINSYWRLPSFQRTMAVSIIAFEIPVVSHVFLGAYDLNGRLVSTIVDLPAAVAGRYSAQFRINGSHGTEVFKCRMVATDTSTGRALYTDSIYAVLWQDDYVLSSLGSTSSDGTFRSNDSLRFPNVLSLPPLVMTNSFGPTPLGTFQISDSVTVVLTDTTARRTESYLCSIKRGQNNLRLTWNPTLNSESTSWPPTSTRPRHSKARESSSPQLVWKLEQNYPNPFN